MQKEYAIKYDAIQDVILFTLLILPVAYVQIAET
jgi:hypothetical protein